MFGTVGRMKVKPGKLDELAKLMQEDQRDIEGAVGFWLYKLEGKEDEVILAVAFRDKESYFKNADSDEQDEAYRKMVDLIDGTPTWQDGEIIASQGS
jgi:quinol monooxygenase YgiN